MPPRPLRTADADGTPIDFPSPSVSAPGTPSVAESPWNQFGEDGEKWYRRVQKSGHSTHPYGMRSIIMPQAIDYHEACDVVFWPWVGELRPERTVPDVNWDDWTNVVAIANGTHVIVGRVSDDKIWEPLWSLDVPEGEIIYRVAWTFDVFNLHPILLFAGEHGVVYAADAVERCIVKEFVGHGGEVLSLSVCPGHPHIFASAAGDKTTRIWNLYGSGPPTLDRPRSQNYPMGDADEGTECIMILAGEGGGHRDKVTSVTFHYNHRAVVTASGDIAVKIWALPPFPLPDPFGTPTPDGYRPKLIHFPVFSTNRIHTGCVENVHWLAPDVLVSRDLAGIIVWHWLGYKRFFAQGLYAPLTDHSQRSDYMNSHSFMVINKYPYPNEDSRWFMTGELHRGFTPLPFEEEKFDKRPHLVTDTLMAYPVDGKEPRIYLWNPLLAEPDAPPDPPTELRPLSPDKLDESDVDTEDPSPLKSEPTNKHTVSQPVKDADKVEAAESSATAMAEQALVPESPTNDSHLSATERVKVRSRKSAGGQPAKTPVKRAVKVEDKRPKNPTIKPWVLMAKQFRPALKYVPATRGRTLRKSIFAAVAISPRGAEWIVAVGILGNLVIFRMREGDEGK